MSKCENYIHGAQLIVKLVYPRTDVILGSVDKFIEENEIETTVDNNIYHQNLVHRKRPRNEKLNDIEFIISNNAFAKPSDTNRKLIGVLQNILKCLDPNLKLDLTLMDSICDVLYLIATKCSEFGIVATYSRYQRNRTKTIYSSINRSENIRLDIYYKYD